jgi:hypothetical protein
MWLAAIVYYLVINKSVYISISMYILCARAVQDKKKNREYKCIMFSTSKIIV